MPVEGLNEEEQLVLAIKASVETALEEQVARMARFIYDRALGSLPIYIFLFVSLSVY